ncbi:MAG: protein kinase [candidate division KSB1 bacterium]|nr:protein kinase [candidate division KSB1 bacterium]
MEKEKSNKQVIDLLYELGNAYLTKGDYDSAINRFKALMELGEKEPKLFLNLSKAYILKGQFDAEAQATFEIAVQHEPDNPVLNVILSDLYLKANRDDEFSIQVYQRALRENPENANQVMSQLIKACIRHDKFDAIEGLMDQLIHTPDKLALIFPFYVAREWKRQRFDGVSQFIRKLLPLQSELMWYRWLAINLLQAKQQLGAAAPISAEEIALCSQYLNQAHAFDRLLDIYLYPAVEKLVNGQTAESQPPEARPIEEYELFLMDSSLSNIWERGINKQIPTAKAPSEPKSVDIWEHLKLWPAAENSHVTEERGGRFNSVPVSQALQQAEAVMIIRLKANTLDLVQADLENAIRSSEDNEKNLLTGFQSRDGIILFWKDLHCPIQSAIQFVKNHWANPAAANGAPFQVLIHKLMASRNQASHRQLLEDMQTSLTAFQLEAELFRPQSASESSLNGNGCQVLITAAVQEQLNGDIHFSMTPVDLPMPHLSSGEALKIYQLQWDDIATKISRGEIKHIGRFDHPRELYSNQIFASFRAIDSFLERLVVIKILRPNMQLNNGQPPLSELFLQQAKILGKLNHQNIALIYDIGREKDFCYIAREYVEGEPIKVQRLINQKINWKRTLKVCHIISQTLGYAHDIQIVHGRLKPNNIFLAANSEVKITDFQPLPFSFPWKSCQEPVLKTLTYLAPEQIESEIVTGQTDIFALGVIMYELLTDKNPFLAADKETIVENILTHTPEPVTALNPELPEKLDQLIFKALQKSPAQRFASIHEMENQLIEIIDAAAD